MTLRSFTSGPFVVVALLGCLLFAGCGWHAGLSSPAGAETLAVRFLGNDGPLRDLEVDLTQAIAEAAIDRLALVPARPDEADLVVQGRIVDYRRRAGIRNPENRLLESGAGILLETELVRSRDGVVLARSSRWLEAGYVIEPGAVPATTPAEFSSRQRVTRNLALGSLLDLFGPGSTD